MLGLELDNCGRTIKNAYCRTYSLWLRVVQTMMIERRTTFVERFCRHRCQTVVDTATELKTHAEQEHGVKFPHACPAARLHSSAEERRQELPAGDHWLRRLVAVRRLRSGLLRRSEFPGTLCQLSSDDVYRVPSKSVASLIEKNTLRDQRSLFHEYEVSSTQSTL